MTEYYSDEYWRRQEHPEQDAPAEDHVSAELQRRRDDAEAELRRRRERRVPQREPGFDARARIEKIFAPRTDNVRPQRELQWVGTGDHMLGALGQKFIRWAEANNIEPECVKHHYEGWWLWRHHVTDLRGWKITVKHGYLSADSADFGAKFARDPGSFTETLTLSLGGVFAWSYAGYEINYRGMVEHIAGHIDRAQRAGRVRIPWSAID